MNTPSGPPRSDPFSRDPENKDGETENNSSLLLSVKNKQGHLIKSYKWNCKDPILIGRSPETDLTISDRSVSSTHLRLEPAENGVKVRDLDSSNGTIYQGSKIVESTLPAGSTLLLGRVSLQIGKEEEQSSTSSSDSNAESSSPPKDNDGDSNDQKKRDPVLQTFDFGRRYAGQSSSINSKEQQQQSSSSSSSDEALNIDWQEIWDTGGLQIAISIVLHIVIGILLALVVLDSTNDREEYTISVDIESKSKSADFQDQQLEMEKDNQTEEKKFLEKKKHTPGINQQLNQEEMGLEQQETDVKIQEYQMKKDFAPADQTVGTQGSRGKPLTGRNRKTAGSGNPFGKRQTGGLAGQKISSKESPLKHAVKKALIWLAQHQNEDGSWGARNFQQHCTEKECEGTGSSQFNTGLTGLALLAYLGAGFKPGSKQKIEGINAGEVTQKATRWLVSNQRANGAFPGDLYSSSIATMALAEAYGMTNQSILYKPLKSGVRYILDAQNRQKAWRYDYRDNQNDTSVTGWCIMSLKSAELAGVTIPEQNINWAMSFIRQATRKKDGRVGYKSVEDQRKELPALTAVGMMARMFTEKNYKDPMLLKGAKLLKTKLPEWPAGNNQYNYYYWYYGTLALYQYTGPLSPGGAGPIWKKWVKRIKKLLITRQKTEDNGHEDGSWDPVTLGGDRGGRVYSTAIGALTLEFYYRYPNVFTGIDNQ